MGETTWTEPKEVTIETEKKYAAVITTAKGAIESELFPKEAPLSATNFKDLADGDLYNNQNLKKEFDDKDYHTCPACLNVGPEEIIYEFKPYSVVRCSNCNVMHLRPVPSSGEVLDLYNSNYFYDPENEQGYSCDYISNEFLVKKTYLKRFKRLKAILTDKLDHIHEVGCAYGFGLEVAENFFKSKVSGSDICKNAIQFCVDKGRPCYCSDHLGRSDAIRASSVDFVYAFDFLEHLSILPPFLKWVHSVLRSNGWFALTTPNMGSYFNRILGKRSPAIRIPEHILYFTEETLINSLLPHFKYIGTFFDYHYARLNVITEKALKMFVGKHNPVKYLNTVNVLIPNGFQLYLFKKM